MEEREAKQRQSFWEKKRASGEVHAKALEEDWGVLISVHVRPNLKWERRLKDKELGH